MNVYSKKLLRCPFIWILGRWTTQENLKSAITLTNRICTNIDDCKQIKNTASMVFNSDWTLTVVLNKWLNFFESSSNNSNLLFNHFVAFWAFRPDKNVNWVFALNCSYCGILWSAEAGRWARRALTERCRGDYGWWRRRNLMGARRQKGRCHGVSSLNGEDGWCWPNKKSEGRVTKLIIFLKNALLTNGPRYLESVEPDRTLLRTFIFRPHKCIGNNFN